MTDSFDPRNAPQVGQPGVADYDTVARLLQITREKLANHVLANTELETLLIIEREKSAKLKEQLDAVINKDKSSNSK